MHGALLAADRLLYETVASVACPDLLLCAAELGVSHAALHGLSCRSADSLLWLPQVTLLRDEVVANFFSPAHFLDHTSFDCGRL